MALDLDGEVAHELVAGLDAVFQEEAVAHGVVGHVALNAQIVGAMHCDAAAECVVNGGVPDVLAFAITHQMPVDGIAGQRHVLAQR